MIKKRTTATGVRYDVRLRGPDGKERCRSFRTRRDAERFERDQRSALDRGNWIDPRHASLTFEDYAERWLAERPDLRPRTVELYESLLRCHILPKFGKLPLGKVTPTSVRSWNASLSAAYPVTGAKAYRLLRQIMGTAVSDELVGRNPCVVRGAGQEHSPERPMLTVAQVAALAEGMPEEWRIAIDLAAWCQLRVGEILGLERRDVDLLHTTISVERTVTHVRGGMQLGPPKTQAGIRTVAVPPNALPALESHLDARVAPEPNAPLLTGPEGRRLRPATLQKAWDAARASVGLPGVHIHDCRHAGATWLAASGASTKEIMRRLGHASSAAALIYQHATDDRDAAIAQALSSLADDAELKPFSGGARDIRGMNGSRTAEGSAS